jgi:hypothetical protein
MSKSDPVVTFAQSILTLVQERNEAVREAEMVRVRTIRPHGRKRTKRPLPRIEFEHFPDPDWETSKCIYWLVIPLREHDIRCEKGDKKPYKEWYIPVGHTRTQSSRGEPPIYDGKVSTPFRDGAHAHFDREAIGLPNLPIWATADGVATNVTPETKPTA